MSTSYSRNQGGADTWRQNTWGSIVYSEHVCSEHMYVWSSSVLGRLLDLCEPPETRRVGSLPHLKNQRLGLVMSDTALRINNLF